MKKPVKQNRSESFLGVNPAMFVSFLHQTVDFTMNSGHRVCKVFIQWVSPEVDPQNSTYGNFIYLVFDNGKFHRIQNNVSNVSQIGLSGSICK